MRVSRKQKADDNLILKMPATEFEKLKVDRQITWIEAQNSTR